jgi:hypothetical protein
MNRRRFVFSLTFASAVLAPWSIHSTRAAAANDAAAIDDMRKNWKSLLAKGADVPLSPEPISRSNEAWKKFLTPVQYEILREDGTERRLSSPLTA